MQKDIYMKLAGTGSMVWLMAVLIGLVGYLMPNDLFLFSGVTAIISGTGILLVSFICLYFSKKNKDQLSFATMLVGWIAAIINIIFGIVMVSNTNSYLFGLFATLPVGIFLILTGLSLRKNSEMSLLARFYEISGLLFFALLPWASNIFLVSNPVLIPLNILATLAFFDMYDTKE